MSKAWNRSAVLATVPALALMTTLAACGGEEKKQPSADDEPTSTPTVTETPSASPTAAAQPPSTTGATYDILNWAQYADDPAVLAWKKTLEALSGSLLRGKLQPDVRTYTDDKMFRLYSGQVQTGLDEGWTIKRVAQAHVESSRPAGGTRTMRICTWEPTASIYRKDGTPLEPVKDQWSRQIVTAKRSGDQWRLSDLKYEAGVCKGVPRP